MSWNPATMFSALAVASLACGARPAAAPSRAPGSPAAADPASPPTAEDRWFDPAAATPENPNLVGYEIFGTGRKPTRVSVSAYRGKSVRELERYPKLQWLGVTYYNVDGNFVFVSSDETPRYYWGPPRALVDAWNERCPSARFEPGIGFYGESWYWGGVGSFGFHAFAADRKPPRAEMSREEASQCLQKLEKHGRGKKLRPPPLPCSSDYSCLDGFQCQKALDARQGVCVKKRRKPPSPPSDPVLARDADAVEAKEEEGPAEESQRP